ncbi:ybaR [Symbiodinium natans]|uniref:YbaR protein n=1 Tax=Symbiodinium natans TaxID=878477 RepID=A0A812LZW2_9DINO|nr:ybaR [Symbiodinium natans]
MLPSPLQPVIERHLDRTKDAAARMLDAYSVQRPDDECCACYSEDLFKSLWERCSESPAEPFLGYYVNVVFGRQCFDFLDHNPDPLEQYASNRRPVRMRRSSITWMLPYESVYVTGLSFACDMPEQVHCKAARFFAHRMV